MPIVFDPSKLVLNLEAIRKEMAKKGKARAVRAGARVIRDAMREGAPVLDAKTVGSTSLDPGDLKANIKVLNRQEDGEPIALVGPIGKVAEIGKVAHAVEYGHRIVTGGKSKLGPDGKFKGGGKVHEQDVPPHPWLRPAFEATQEEALAVVAETLEQGIAEAVQR